MKRSNTWFGGVVAALLTVSGAQAAPAAETYFAGCVLESSPELLVLRSSGVPVTLNLTRMGPVDVSLALDECVTVRAYRGEGPDLGIWFAESIQEGDERIETTGREFTRESTSDSPAKPKRQKPD